MRPVIFPTVALVGAALGCSGRQTFTNPDAPIELRRGTEFDLALVSNQSTGYRWVMVDSAGLGPLRLVGTTYHSNHPERNGAGGTEHWTFSAPAAGKGVVSLVYVRPFASAVPTDTTRFHVTVR